MAQAVTERKRFLVELGTDEREVAGTPNGLRSVLILTHFFPPEPCAAANRVVALLRALGDVPFDVHVVTGVASFPSGVIAESDRVIWPKTSSIGHARLTRVWTYASPELSGRNRVLNWLSVAFAATSYVCLMKRRYSFVIVTIPPITLVLPALCAIVRHRAKLIVDVRDVFPDVAIRMGYWRKNGLAARIVGAIAATAYRAAKLVLCVTDSARAEIVARGSNLDTTIVASNGFDPIRVASELPYRKGPNEFVAAFVGNMGLATGLDVILDAALIVRDDPRLRFVLAGGGADFARLARRVARERLDNVILLGVVPRDAANALIESADVAVVPLHPSLSDSLPTKLFDALVLGCPVVCCAQGEARDFVERSGGGVALPPEDAAALAATLRALLVDAPARKAFAQRGRAYVLEHYDRSKIMLGVAARLAAMP